MIRKTLLLTVLIVTVGLTTAAYTVEPSTEAASVVKQEAEISAEGIACGFMGYPRNRQFEAASNALTEAYVDLVLRLSPTKAASDLVNEQDEAIMKRWHGSKRCGTVIARMQALTTALTLRAAGLPKQAWVIEDEARAARVQAEMAEARNKGELPDYNVSYQCSIGPMSSMPKLCLQTEQMAFDSLRNGGWARLPLSARLTCLNRADEIGFDGTHSGQSYTKLLQCAVGFM